MASSWSAELPFGSFRLKTSSSRTGVRRSNTSRSYLRAAVTIVYVSLAGSAFAQTLNLPLRATNAPDGSVFAKKISTLGFAEREQAILNEVLAGDVPTFLRKLCPVTVTNVVGDKTNFATFYAAPEYLAIGSDQDYLLSPMSPNTAQRIADQLGCVLPTRKMVDAIYAAAEVKLAPSPIPPSAAMTTVPVFVQHDEMVHTQRGTFVKEHPLGALVAGHKKDVVISRQLSGVTNKVAIYGWHQTNGVAIQPLYLGHTAAWVDYSHGIRLVQSEMVVNGETKTVAAVLADPTLCGLISDEGVITNARYQFLPGSTSLRPVVSGVAAETGGTHELELNSTNHQLRTFSAQIRRDAGFNGRDARSTNQTVNPPWPEKFAASPHFGEMIREIELPNDVRILVNAPSRESFAPDKPLLLIFYALPNGNTIEQTIGKTLKPGDDWHFDIQHIAAQTRWLRNEITNRTIVVAYLEAGMKSWPAWRKVHDDQSVARILDDVRGFFAGRKLEVVLTGHSGGGSLTFGYLNAVEEIPDYVVRIAFLDSNYAYETQLHAEKLKRWLADSEGHHLCVLAYHDSVALLNGKTFVSEQGGTWGRSHVMLENLGAHFKFTSRTNQGLETFSALGGRIQFLLKENPEKKILHTVQVERNGFIQAMVSDTTEEGRGYEYFGEPAYARWIQDE
jgi:hypothetical protein